MKPNQFRPPVVAIMGHIDHGKTTLLDRIRQSDVASREAGGITQHISAYQTTVKLKNQKTGTITFIDTPGHAAFCQMRARGAQVTDLAILVVSAVDGVMAQTKECINQIKNANIPVIIAMTKIDLPQNSPEKVKGQLVELGLTPEEYGGQIPLIPVSAKTGEGIDELLGSILLHAEIMELKNEATVPLEAFVIESKLEKNRGPVALLVVKKGTLHLGDSIYVDDLQSKVKALIDSSNKPISEASPSTPVEVLGFAKVPAVASMITSSPVTPKDISSIPPTEAKTDSTTPKLPLVLKADTQGTLEALLNSFSDDVLVIHTGIGPVSDNDIFLAQAAHAEIFAFNVPLPRFIKNLADNQKVPVFQSKIIYEIIENIQNQVLKMLEPTIDETVLGEGTIIAEFKIDKVRIAGVHCTKGEIGLNDPIHLKRDGQIIKDTKVEGIHHNKEIVPKAKSGNDYGITFKPYIDFKLNDVIIAYNKSKWAG